MNTILNYFDRLMTAITFAETNEQEMAEKYIGRRRPGQSNREQENTKSPQITGSLIRPNQTAH